MAFFLYDNDNPKNKKSALPIFTIFYNVFQEKYTRGM